MLPGSDASNPPPPPVGWRGDGAWLDENLDSDTLRRPDAVAAVGLGAVEGLVGGGQERRDGGAFARDRGRDPEADRGGELGPRILVGDLQLGDDLPKPVRAGEDALFVRGRQNDDELLPPYRATRSPGRWSAV